MNTGKAVLCKQSSNHSLLHWTCRAERIFKITNRLIS